MPFISKIKLPSDDTTYDIKSKTTQGILYGEVASTSTASAFTATISDLNITAYYDGFTVMLKNSVVNAGSVFTLNINGLGAKEVKTNSVSANGNSLFVNGSTMIFVYSSTAATGGAWYCYHGVDNVSGMYFVAGSGSTAAKTSSPYYAARWRGNNPSITTLYSGLCIYYKIDVAGNGSYGTVLSINGGPEHPVVANVNTMVSTRYPVNCVIPLVYDANQTATAYINSASASTITGCWKIADYDSNTVTQTVARDFKVSPNAGILYRYQICLVAEDDGLVPYNNVNNATGTYTKALNSAPFDPFKGMFWYGTTANINPGQGVSVGTNAVYIVYQQDVRYSFNINSGVSSSQVAATNGATVYNTSYKYAVGAYCTYLGELYKCKTAITTAGAWNANQWTKITQYSAFSTYAVNAECLHDGYLYKCTTAISQVEAWNPTHWTLSTITGLISQEPVYIKAKYNTTTRTATLVGDASSPSYLVRSGLAQGLPESNPNAGLAANEFYIYIFIGQAYTCYNVGMFAMHPIFYWNEKAGKATIFTGVEDALPSVTSSDNGKLLTVVNGEWAPATKPSYTATEVGALPSNTTYVSSVNGQSGNVTVATPGTLNTNNTTAQTVPANAESLSGAINLHKIAKTGTYSDLIGKPTDANGIVPLANGGTGLAVNDSDWYSGDILHPRFEVLYDIDDGGFYVRYTGPLDGISDISDFYNSDYFKAAVRSLVPMWVGGFGVMFFGTAMVMTGFLAEADIEKIYILFPDAILYYGQYVNGLKGTLVYDVDGVYMLRSSMHPLTPGWTTLLDSISSVYPLSYDPDTHEISHDTILGNSISLGLYKISADEFGHVTGSSAVQKSDITALGIPGTDTNTTYSLNVSGTGDNANKVGLVAGGSGSGITWYTIPYATTAGSAGTASSVAWSNVVGHDAGVDTDLGINTSSGDTTKFLNNKGGWTVPYTHPTYTSATAAAVKVGRDGTGHVVLGTAITAADVGALSSNTTYVSTVNGQSGAVTVTDTNTTYTLKVDGTGNNANQLGLVAGGSGSGTQWVTISYAENAGYAGSAGTANSVAWSDVTGHDAGVDSDLGINTTSGDTTKFLNAKGGWTVPAGTYTHPTYTAITAAAVKVGRDSTGHTIIGDALQPIDVDFILTDYTLG